MRTPSWFDLRAGIGGALLMGCIAAVVNAPHGALPAAVSAGKQAAYTFLFGGLIVQLCTRLAARRGPRARVLTGAVAIPFVITVALVSLVHGLRGTPEPVVTTAVVALLALPSFALLARRARQQVETAAEAANA